MPVADFWLDPSCPYTWTASRWILEVAQVRPVEVRWHVMSLSVLNEGRDDDPEGDPEGYLWYPVRICAAVQHEQGQEALGRVYTALGRRWHEAETPDWAAIPDALAEAGVPRELAGATESTAYDEVVRASHAEGIARLGPHIGTPIVAVTPDEGEPYAFFGPVVSTIPTGEQAGRLWDGVTAVASTPGFHELKGTAAPEDPLRG